MKAFIISDVAPLKTKASFEVELADEVLFGMPIEILGHEEGDWYRIRTHYRYEALIHNSYFILEELASEKWLKGEKKMVIKDYADVLNAPKVQGGLIQGLPRGSWITLEDELIEDRWQRVVLPNGVEGFTRVENLIDMPSPAEDESQLRRALVESAKLYEGAQYRWGGKSVLGLDCSGLVAMAYMLNGILIYRDAVIVDGFPIKEIPKDQLKMGDLMFFPGHVAMYIEEGRYIHSSAGLNGVGYNSLNKEDEDYNKYLDENFTKAGSIF